MAEQRWLKKSGEVSSVMAEAGFASVFEHKSPNAYGRNTVYTLWVLMGEGLEVLTIVDGNGAFSMYRLTPISGAAREVAEAHDAERAEEKARTA